MRIFSLLFIMIILALNFVPCADVQEGPDQQSTALHQQTAPDHSHLLNDNCSPFCHCACCSSSSVVQLLQLSSVPFTEYTNQVIPYFNGNYIDISLPIWQPPQWS